MDDLLFVAFIVIVIPCHPTIPATNMLSITQWFDSEWLKHRRVATRLHMCSCDGVTVLKFKFKSKANSHFNFGAASLSVCVLKPHCTEFEFAINLILNLKTVITSHNAYTVQLPLVNTGT